MYLQDLINRYPSEQLEDLYGLIRQFINCQLQILIGDTFRRSWEQEEARLSAVEVSTKLRGPPWNFTIEELEFLSDNASSILEQIG